MLCRMRLIVVVGLGVLAMVVSLDAIRPQPVATGLLHSTRAVGDASDIKRQKRPPNLFGTGEDGSLHVESGPVRLDSDWALVTASAPTDATHLHVHDPAVFRAGDYVLIHQARGSNVGNWSFNRIQRTEGNTLYLRDNIPHPVREVGSLESNEAYVIRVSQFTDCHIGPDATLSARPWDGESGGLLVLICSGRLLVEGLLDVTGLGYRGGEHVHKADAGCAYAGEGPRGRSIRSAISLGEPPAGGGGGGGSGPNLCNTTGPGGGGGHRTAGEPGGATGVAGAPAPGFPLRDVMFGAGGGGPKTFDGASLHPGVAGGSGGGAMLIFAREIDVRGRVLANGSQARGYAEESTSRQRYTGGGGAGGAIYITAQRGQLGEGRLQAQGAAELPIPGDASTNTVGGAGGQGHVYVRSCEYVTGGALPEIEREEIRCPDRHAHLPYAALWHHPKPHVCLTGHADGDDDTISAAQRRAPMCPGVPIRGVFDSEEDLEDVFRIEVRSDAGAPVPIRITLSGLPLGVDYDIGLYDDEQVLLASARERVGEDQILFSPPPGDYFVQVHRFRGVSTEPYDLRWDYADTPFDSRGQ